MLHLIEGVCVKPLTSYNKHSLRHNSEETAKNSPNFLVLSAFADTNTCLFLESSLFPFLASSIIRLPLGGGSYHSPQLSFVIQSYFILVWDGARAESNARFVAPRVLCPGECPHPARTAVCSARVGWDILWLGVVLLALPWDDYLSLMILSLNIHSLRRMGWVPIYYCIAVSLFRVTWTTWDYLLRLSVSLSLSLCLPLCLCLCVSVSLCLSLDILIFDLYNVFPKSGAYMYVYLKPLHNFVKFIIVFIFTNLTCFFDLLKYKVCFTRYEYCYFASVFVSICVMYLSSAFIPTLFVGSGMWWVSCNQYIVESYFYPFSQFISVDCWP